MCRCVGVDAIQPTHKSCSLHHGSAMGWDDRQDGYMGDTGLPTPPYARASPSKVKGSTSLVSAHTPGHKIFTDNHYSTCL